MQLNKEVRLAIRVENYEAVKYFYEHILNFLVFNSWDRGLGERGTLYQIGGLLLEIEDTSSERAATKLNDDWSISIEIIGVENFRNELAEKGLTNIEAVEHTSWGHTRFAIKDPAGLKIKFFELS